MSKSNVCTRLTSLFATRKPTKTSIKLPKPTTTLPDPNTQNARIPKPKPTIIPATLTYPNSEKTIGQKIRDLLVEKDSKILVEKFKNLSNYSYFRERCRDIYSLTIHRLAIAKQYTLIEQALDSQKPFVSNQGFASRIIHLYGKYGMFDQAYKVFDELPERNCKRGVNVLNALLGAAANSGKYDKVYELFRELPGKLSIEVNVGSYNTAMHALCKMGEVEKAVLLLGEMEEGGLKPCVVSYNTLLFVFYEAGECEEGDKVWERMIASNVVPDIKSYNFKLQGLIKNEKVLEVIELVMQLKSKGLKPDVNTYNAVIQGLIKGDNFGCVKEWYEKLIKSGCVPNKTTFSTLVPFLCEKGDYVLAFEVCEYMFRRRNCVIDETALQNVVDGLAKDSMADKAKVLVELALSSSYAPYHLVMPDNA